MEKTREEKLQRYLLNADPFLWGILEATNKHGRLKELKESGVLKSYSSTHAPSYTKINQDLLVELGVAGILGTLVCPRVIKTFEPKILYFFQRCWEQGRTPDIHYLIDNHLYHSHKGSGRRVGRDVAQIFLQIHRQHEFVERWTAFAGLWFEEIAPR